MTASDGNVGPEQKRGGRAGQSDGGVAYRDVSCHHTHQRVMDGSQNDKVTVQLKKHASDHFLVDITLLRRDLVDQVFLLPAL